MPNAGYLFLSRLAEVREGRYSLFPEPAHLAQEAYIRAGQRESTVAMGESDGTILIRYARGKEEMTGQHRGRLALLVACVDCVADDMDLETARWFIRRGNPPLIEIISAADMINDSARELAVIATREQVSELLGNIEQNA